MDRSLVFAKQHRLLGGGIGLAALAIFIVAGQPGTLAPPRC